MARGWESKSVEAQQAEADDKSAKPHAKMTAEEAAQKREEDSLRLARNRVLQQLETASKPQHRDLLQRALDDLDAKLRRLADEPRGKGPQSEV